VTYTVTIGVASAVAVTIVRFREVDPPTGGFDKGNGIFPGVFPGVFHGVQTS
jgi:hypothetical protein